MTINTIILTRYLTIIATDSIIIQTINYTNTSNRTNIPTTQEHSTQLTNNQQNHHSLYQFQKDSHPNKSKIMTNCRN